jgi:hypothetical protein
VVDEPAVPCEARLVVVVGAEVDGAAVPSVDEEEPGPVVVDVPVESPHATTTSAITSTSRRIIRLLPMALLERTDGHSGPEWPCGTVTVATGWVSRRGNPHHRASNEVPAG